MNALHSELENLYRILDRESAAYRALQAEVERESECLRKGSPEALMSVIKDIENHRAAILQIREEMKGAVEALGLILGSKETEKDFSTLITALPVPAQQKIRAHGRELGRIREWIGRCNERNKSFIREWQACCREVFSILFQPLAGAPAYNRNGWTKPAHAPFALNRKV